MSFHPFQLFECIRSDANVPGVAGGGQDHQTIAKVRMGAAAPTPQTETAEDSRRFLRSREMPGALAREKPPVELTEEHLSLLQVRLMFL